MCLKEKLAEYVVTSSDSFNKQTEVQKQYKPKRGPSHITSHTRQVLNWLNFLICSFQFSLRHRELLQIRYMQASFYIFTRTTTSVTSVTQDQYLFYQYTCKWIQHHAIHNIMSKRTLVFRMLFSKRHDWWKFCSKYDYSPESWQVVNMEYLHKLQYQLQGKFFFPVCK